MEIETRRLLRDGVGKAEKKDGNTNIKNTVIVELLNEIMFPDQKTTVLLETMAGKGSEIGGRFEELKARVGEGEKILFGVVADLTLNGKAVSSDDLTLTVIGKVEKLHILE